MDVVTEPAQLIDQSVEPSLQRGGEQAEFLWNLDRHILHPQSGSVRFEQRVLSLTGTPGYMCASELLRHLG